MKRPKRVFWWAIGVGKRMRAVERSGFLKLDLLGSKGALRDNRVYSSALFPEQNDWVTLPSATPNSGAVHHHPFQQVIDNLVEDILDGKPVLSDILDGARSIAVALAIEESAASGKPVTIPEL